MITQAVSKEDREAGVKGNILGNVKVFWREQAETRAPQQQQPQQQPKPVDDGFSDDIPFR